MCQYQVCYNWQILYVTPKIELEGFDKGKLNTCMHKHSATSSFVKDFNSYVGLTLC